MNISIFANLQNKVDGFGINRFYKFIALILITILLMHPIHSILGLAIKPLFIFSIVCLFTLGLLTSRGVLSQKIVYVALAIISTGLLGSVVSGSFHQLLIATTGAAMIVVASLLIGVCKEPLFLRSIIGLDYMILFLSLGAFIYAYMGGKPIFWVVNQETKIMLPYYLTGFTNTVDFLKLIRPAGVFDEPGSLAMFNILVVCVNEVMRKDWITSLKLLLLGLITFSLMAIFALFIFILIYRREFFELCLKNFLAIGTVMVAALMLLISQWSELYLFFFRRLTIINGVFIGDNRWRQVKIIFDNLDSKIFFQGIVAQKIHFSGEISSNPFTLLFESGVFIWLLYLILELILLKMIFIRDKGVQFSALIMLILLLQRPSIWSLYWGLFIWVVFFLVRDKYLILKARTII